MPKAVLAALGAKPGEPLDIGVEDGRLVAARPGELTDRVTISAEEERDLRALAGELSAAAARMAAQLDTAIADLREANDPDRDALYRRRALAELHDAPVVLDFGARPA